MSIAAQQLSGSYAADPSHSSFMFAVKHMKVATYRTTFDDVDATLTVDGQGARLEGRCRVASAAIRDPGFRAAVVDGPDFFDAGRHPEMAFRSDEVAFGEDGTVSVNGELTIKDVTRPVVASGTYEPPIEDPFGRTRTAVQLHAKVDRRDWGITWQTPLPKGGDMLGWEVEIAVVLEFVRQDA